MSEDTPPAAKDVGDVDVVALAKEAIEASREETRRSVAADTDVATPDSQTPKELQQPGVTIDLGHKNIHRLPDEVIDVIRDEIERLALSHNALSALPPRLSECKRLRYLNVRYNVMREFPAAVLQLSSLEILDVSKNRIRELPEGLGNLTSLKVLAIQKNKVERLPLCLGDIGSLQVLKLDGNPLVFPPPDICSIRKDAPSPANENEKDAVITTQVKRYLRQVATRERLKVESEGESSEGVETPRPPRRIMSGRFPVKPSISGLEAFVGDPKADSPSGAVPPVPVRSHYRGQSQQGSAVRRPAIAPLVLMNERNRSHSEGASSASLQSKRRGMHVKKRSELGLEVRNNHFRGFSQGSVLSGTTLNGTSASSSNNNSFGSSYSGGLAGASELPNHRGLPHRPLSDLLEHKRRSRAPDVVVEASKTMLYALYQLHDPLSNLSRSAKSRRDRLAMKRHAAFEQFFAITYLEVNNLNDLLQRFDTLAEEDEEEAHQLSIQIRRSCCRSLEHFRCTLVALCEAASDFVRHGDLRFVRTLLLMEHGSLMEIRNICATLGVNFTSPVKVPRIVQENGRHAHSKQQRPLPLPRFHSAYQHPSKVSLQNNALPPVSLNGGDGHHDISRTNTMTSTGAITPRSGESFGTLGPISRSGTMVSLNEFDEEAQFEWVYRKLRYAVDSTLEGLPLCRHQFLKARDAARRDFDGNDGRVVGLTGLIEKTNDLINITINMKDRLMTMQLKDPVVRNSPEFWQQCTSYIKAWGNLVAAVAGQGRHMGLINEDVKAAMKPVHKAVKAVSLAINDSPWSHLTVSSFNGSFGNAPVSPAATPTGTMASNPNAGHRLASIKSSLSASNPAYPALPTSNPNAATSFPGVMPTAQLGYVTPVPATPLSAALGAAAQATVPSTPSTHTPNISQTSLQQPAQHHTGVFAGNVFERADRLLATQAQQQQQQQQQGTQRRII